MYKVRQVEFCSLDPVVIEKPCVDCEFKIGDRVYWDSSGTRKEGTVVVVIKPFEFPPTIEANPGYEFKSFGFGRPRRKVSYMIVLDLIPGHRKRKLYWPTTSQLRRVNGT